MASRFPMLPLMAAPAMELTSADLDPLSGRFSHANSLISYRAPAMIALATTTGAGQAWKTAKIATVPKAAGPENFILMFVGFGNEDRRSSE